MISCKVNNTQMAGAFHFNIFFFCTFLFDHLFSYVLSVLLWMSFSRYPFVMPYILLLFPENLETYLFDQFRLQIDESLMFSSRPDSDSVGVGDTMLCCLYLLTQRNNLFYCCLMSRDESEGTCKSSLVFVEKEASSWCSYTGSDWDFCSRTRFLVTDTFRLVTKLSL